MLPSKQASRGLPLPPDFIRDGGLDLIAKGVEIIKKRTTFPGHQTTPKPARVEQPKEAKVATQTPPPSALQTSSVQTPLSEDLRTVPRAIQTPPVGELQLPPPGYMYSSRKMSDGSYEFRGLLGSVKKMTGPEYVENRDILNEEGWFVYEYTR